MEGKFEELFRIFKQKINEEIGALNMPDCCKCFSYNNIVNFHNNSLK